MRLATDTVLSDLRNSSYEQGTAFNAHPALVATPQSGTHPIPVAVELTRVIGGREQRLMIIGEADFMSNREIVRQTPQQGNLALALETFKWLSHGRLPVDATRPKPNDHELLVDRSWIATSKVCFCGVIPVGFALCGATLLIRRRRR